MNCLGLLLRDAELPAQRERALAVDRGEVDRLGAGAHLGGHRLDRHAEDERRGLPVDVAALQERLDEGRVAREVRHEAQLDLRVVGDQERPSPRARDEPAPDRLAPRGADRDVLQVRLGRS